MRFSALFASAIILHLASQTAAQGPSLRVYLVNITIFKTLETALPFSSNHPEVYLSCDDQMPRVELDDVRRTDRLFEFPVGTILATRLFEDGCERCKLRESDAGPLLEDDTFGEWSMCQSDFAETGSFVVDRPGSFIIGLQCPDCTENVPKPQTSEPLAAPESLPSEEIPIEAAPPSDPIVESVTNIIDSYYEYYSSG